MPNPEVVLRLNFCVLIATSLVFNPGEILFRAKKTSNSFPWGIIGTAIANGWDGKDIVLNKNAKSPNYYFLTNQKLKAGELRFRLNNDWINSLGLNNDDKSVCDDGYNFKIKENGFYDIVLDLTIESKPKYSIKLADK